MSSSDLVLIFDIVMRSMDSAEAFSSSSDGAILFNRAWWIGVLACADPRDIAAISASIEPDHMRHQIVKPAETGTVMLEGRAGGSGQRFNFGEVTVTRCVVRLTDGTIGVAYALGREKSKAIDCALIDANLQSADDTIRERILAQLLILDQKRIAGRELKSKKASATKVNFFTLVRGEG
jgi:alpha-D-ribose 1-methylphosphonate 5-triphosphate synthase subunit PhnG